MNKPQITISFTLEPNNPDQVTALVVQEQLRKLGKVYTHFVSETATATAQPDFKQLWVYVPYDWGDEADSHLMLVPKRRTIQGGKELGFEAQDLLLNHGVCDFMYADYPHFNNHGAPHCAVHEDYAMGKVADIGFKIDASSFTSEFTDRGDNSGEEIWLSIRVPAEIADQLSKMD